ncbi:MAG TPA: response regulator transcription factor [Kiritimatiellia bacterium]|nr:response regulator transcription factor [Kiritimatiellia bacterium]HMP00168.1 response regulator transcription factor [Kiritimatiellia bacterium]HMP96807.1 response regulator transcription factor [Kiritimatiellia bacterium]
MNERVFSHTLLVVEDNTSLRRSLTNGLSDLGYRVMAVATVAEARRVLSKEEVHAVVLDLGLPDGDGQDFLREIRETGLHTPVIILTARTMVDEKVRAFDGGADDYLVKPFEFQELAARLRARLRTGEGALEVEWIIGDVVINAVRREVRRGSRIIECTPREFDLLVHLARAGGAPVSRQTLAREVWKVTSRMISMDNVIDVTISRLREKLNDGTDRTILHTVRGLGFVLRESS